jgi:hypothetical protein
LKEAQEEIGINLVLKNGALFKQYKHNFANGSRGFLDSFWGWSAAQSSLLAHATGDFSAQSFDDF